MVSCQRFKMAKITTNQSESLNAVMKRLNDWTEVPIDAMATSLFQLTQSYVREIMRGRYLRGVDGYTLLPHLIPLYNLEKDKPILPPSDFHADVEAIVPKIMNAVKRSNDYIHTRSENEEIQDGQTIIEEDATSNSGEYRLTTYARAMEVIENQWLSFHEESGKFIIKSNLQHFIVQLFPTTQSSCAAAKTGLCHRVLACEIKLGIRNEESKKPNSSVWRKRGRKSNDKTPGRKKPRLLDVDEDIMEQRLAVEKFMQEMESPVVINKKKHKKTYMRRTSRKSKIVAEDEEMVRKNEILEVIRFLWPQIIFSLHKILTISARSSE